ncbi:MAG: mechanosensitive ion channel family protein [Pseudomonadota bacterium]
METFETFFQDLWASRYAQAGVVLLSSMVVAWLVNRLVTRVLAAWARRSRTELDDKVIALLHGPIVQTVILIGAAIAIARIEPSAGLLALSRRILVTIGVILWMLFSLRLSTLLLKAASTNPTRFRAVEDRTFPLFDNVAKVVVLAVAVYLLLAAWKIDATGWIASAGIVGIAVGFAAKDSLSNLFAGVFIIVDAPYRVGDFIVLDSGERGQVVHIGIRSTRLLTRDDMEITIPNAIMGNAKIINETQGPAPHRRVRIPVSVAYDSDLGKVRAVLLEIGEANPMVLQDPAPRVRFRSFGESGLALELLCWIPEPVLNGRATDALNTAVFERFKAEGIEIPYPKRDLYVKEAPKPLPRGPSV